MEMNDILFNEIINTAQDCVFRNHLCRMSLGCLVVRVPIRFGGGAIFSCMNIENTIKCKYMFCACKELHLNTNHMSVVNMYSINFGDDHMDDNKKAAFNLLFENMIDSMTNPDSFDRKEFVGILAKMCELFRVAKGVTEFYKSISDERDGKGEVLIDYDNGRGEKVVLSRRIITKSKAIIKGTLYAAEDEVPLDEEELEKLDITLRSLLSFVSRNRLQTTVERLAFYDEQGYPNMNYFFRHLDMLDAEGKIAGNTVVCYNLRQFSLINKEIGRNAGDVVMRNYFLMLEDMLNDDGVICRVGGDNFALIFSSDLLQNILDIIRGVPVSYGEDNDKRVMVSAAAGVFVIPDGYEYERPADIFGNVYTAVQDAKAEHRGTIIYHDEKMLEARGRMLEIWRRFPKAIEDREFHAFYQPKVDVLTGEIVGAEALCRWIRDGKIVPPMDFIPMLEQNTDICTLDFHMLDIVCKDIKRWISEGRKPVRVSVNLSRKHLVDVDLLEHIMAIIEDNDVPHEYVEIELTETTTDVEFRDLKRIVFGLQKEGIFTSVDDFGMGYSSLNLIREIPWNVLKIDKCFLPTGEDDNGVTDLMFRHVVAMAQDMGLECVTEGVETLTQVGLLRDNNCRIAQGFYFDRPLSVEEFEERLGRHRYEVS